VLLFPVVQPWYLLWAIIPMAAWATRPGFRIAAITVTLIVGIFGPTANGDRFALFQIVDATLASALIVALLMVITHNHLPWRKLLAPADDLEPRPVESHPTPGQAKAVADDAYAESP
jgi:alpha-1,6-mannosyltransferase